MFYQSILQKQPGLFSGHCNCTTSSLLVWYRNRQNNGMGKGKWYAFSLYKMYSGILYKKEMVSIFNLFYIVYHYPLLLRPPGHSNGERPYPGPRHYTFYIVKMHTMSFFSYHYYAFFYTRPESWKLCTSSFKYPGCPDEVSFYTTYKQMPYYFQESNLFLLIPLLYCLLAAFLQVKCQIQFVE